MSVLFEYWIETETGRRYFRDIKEANREAQAYANESELYCVRYDLRGGQALFYPKP
jgi:hypothetical protein